MGSPDEGSSFRDQIYSVGEEVEVSSDEPGFKGSWYVATVIQPPIPKKYTRARVEYRTLLTEDGSEPLKEYVDEGYIRPKPPQEEFTAQDLELGGVVGAYCRDGWWTGVVVKVLGDSRYRVYFKNPPDVIEFDRKELRVHKEWLNGIWVRPDKRQKTGSSFSTGMDVEVNVEEENLSDAWFPAIVIKENKDDTFFVKYQSSRNGDEAELGKVTVDLLHIRPSPPPPHTDIKYNVLEKVDAFCEFAWRAGVIAKCVTDTKYLVYFKQTNEDRIFNQSTLRPRMQRKGEEWVSGSQVLSPFPLYLSPRMQWIDEEWVSGSQELIVSSDFQEQTRDTCNNASNPEVTVQVESSVVAKDNMDESIPPTNSVKNLMEQSSPDDEKVVTRALTPGTRKIKLLNPKGNPTELHPPKKLKTTMTSEALLSATACQLRKKRSKISRKVLSRSAPPKSGGKQQRHSGVLGNQPFTKNESLARKVKVKYGELDSQKSSRVNKRGRRPKSLVKSPPSSAAVKEGNAGGGTAKEIVPETIRKEAEMPVILGLEAKVIGVSRSGNFCQLSDLKDTNHRAEDRSLVVTSQLASVASLANLLHSLGLCLDTEIDQQKSEGNSIKRKRGRPRKFVDTSSKASDGGEEQNGVEGTEIVVEDHSTQAVASDMLAGVKSADSSTDDVGMSSIAAPGNMDVDDQPLATWIGERLQCPPNAKESKLSPGLTVDECNEARKQQHDIVQVPATVATGDFALDENRSFPFEKTSLLWKTIESMEIFRMLPQYPHFRPLSKCSEVYREGLAIGNMVAFSSLVEKISKLQLDDPRRIFDSYLESLLDLEKLGFDVTVLRGRINEMLSIKDKQGLILNESKDAECKILRYSREKTEMAEEMANIEKQIAELQEKHALMKSEKESKEHEMSVLQVRVIAINEELQSTRLGFEKIADAPWKLG
ncbi:DUF724 domain-containing protein 7-like isoform X3 [Corylus avellana]|uniref:DUF724 domain-containing protein 7-like isoform X3 n=1 Tax=Corylus avellana TaxID=13451 RepID=UPI00286A647A|nr:DUF724 domain-containing protein 7-like isoform X3 [Corylus avellana]